MNGRVEEAVSRSGGSVSARIARDILRSIRWTRRRGTKSRRCWHSIPARASFLSATSSFAASRALSATRR